MGVRSRVAGVLLCSLMAGLLVWGSWPSDPTVNVALCTAEGDQGGNGIAVAANQDGGAIVAWYDPRGVDVDIYAQKIGANGSLLWFTDTPVCTFERTQTYPAIAGDGNGGALIAWQDWRNLDSGGDIYVQSVFSSMIFADGFESASTTAWSSASP